VLREVDAPAQWVRRAALDAITAQGERVPDTAAAALVPIIVQHLATESTILAPAAADLAGAITWQLTSDDAQRVAEAFAPFAPREPGHYRLTDRGMWAFAGRAYEMHAELRPALADLLAVSAVGNGLDSNLTSAIAHCAADPEPVVTRLIEQAQAGHAAAAALLTDLNRDLPIVHDRERQRLLKILERPSGPRTEFTLASNFGIAPVALARFEAPLRRRYADKLLAIAKDDHEMVMNRAVALEALAQAASALTAEERANYLPDVLALTGTLTLSALEQHQALTDHPLSRFRLHFGSADEVRVSALGAAVELSATTQERERIATEAVRLMHDPATARAVANVLVRLARAGLHLDPDDLTASAEPALRAVAAVLWCERPEDHDFGRHLARDATALVRAQIAMGLPTIGQSSPMLADELRSVLEADSYAKIRWLARKTVGSDDGGAPRDDDRTAVEASSA
jgi:hypothetical protein